MEEQAETLLKEPAPAPKKNAGWFRQGDRRINRQGRPLGSSKAPPAEGVSEDRAARPDRLMVLYLTAHDLLRRLSHGERRWDLDYDVRYDFGIGIRCWITNFPDDCQIVSTRLDETRSIVGKGGPLVVIVLRSKLFPRVAKGAVIPPFLPRFNSDFERPRCKYCGR